MCTPRLQQTVRNLNESGRQNFEDISLCLRVVPTKMFCPTINRMKEEEMKCRDSSIEMGFEDKFVEIFRLRNKLTKISAEISEKKWSQSWYFMWGNELYYKTVLYANPTLKNC